MAGSVRKPAGFPAVLRGCDGSPRRRSALLRAAGAIAFRDVRVYFPIDSQLHVYRVIEHYVALAVEYVDRPCRRAYRSTAVRFHATRARARGRRASAFPCRAASTARRTSTSTEDFAVARPRCAQQPGRAPRAPAAPRLVCRPDAPRGGRRRHLHRRRAARRRRAGHRQGPKHARGPVGRRAARRRRGARARRRDAARSRALRARDDRRHERAARGRRRAHRAARHRGLHRSRGARPPGARRPLPAVRRAPGAARAAGAALRRARAHGPGRRAAAARRASAARARRELAAATPKRSRSACCWGSATPSTSARVGELLAERAARACTCRSRTRPVGTFREYERSATTEVDAALSPLLRALSRRARASAPATRPARARGDAVQRRAGRRRARRPRHAALTVLSGPGRRRGGRRWVAARPARRTRLLRHGRHVLRRVRDRRRRGAETGGREVGGRPLALPMLDIHTVGAGGGSIAWRDAGGALRVGPALGGRRARARPATAAAATSRRSPTPTCCSGCSTPTSPLAGGVALDRDAAERAVGALARRARPRPARDAPRGSCASPGRDGSARCA